MQQEREKDGKKIINIKSSFEVELTIINFFRSVINFLRFPPLRKKKKIYAL
jgi:hypothetical protein